MGEDEEAPGQAKCCPPQPRSLPIASPPSRASPPWNPKSSEAPQLAGVPPLPLSAPRDFCEKPSPWDPWGGSCGWAPGGSAQAEQEGYPVASGARQHAEAGHLSLACRDSITPAGACSGQQSIARRRVLGTWRWAWPGGVGEESGGWGRTRLARGSRWTFAQDPCRFQGPTGHLARDVPRFPPLALPRSLT